MPDYELLELVLFFAIPRKDVKALAKNLLKEFKDFNGVLTAPPARLMKVSGVGERTAQDFSIIAAAARRLAKAKIVDKEVISSWSALIEYCTISMAHRQTEQFRILFLDKKNTLIADEEQQSGTVDHVPVYPREVVRRALELNASALILVHNHPSGDPTPSEADISMTLKIEAAAETMGIVLHDHVIIGRGRESSFRSLGLIG